MQSSELFLVRIVVGISIAIVLLFFMDMATNVLIFSVN